MSGPSLTGAPLVRDVRHAGRQGRHRRGDPRGPGRESPADLLRADEQARKNVERDRKGEPIVWTIEMAGSAEMARQGISVNTFPPGTIFSVGLHPLRNGQPAGSREGGCSSARAGRRQRQESIATRSRDTRPSAKSRCRHRRSERALRSPSQRCHHPSPDNSLCARARSRSICSGVAPRLSRMSSMKARATSPSPE